MHRYSFLALASLFTSAFAEVQYQFVPDFIKPPAGKQTIGNGHGEIAVDSSGQIYVSVQEANAGIQVYSSEGKFLKALPLPSSLHGFVIRKDGDGEYLFGAVLSEQKVIKCSLDGQVLMTIAKEEFPADKIGKGLRLTNCDVAPNGDIYVVDGYGADWIFVFSREGKFKKVFGGRVPPLNLANAHKIFVDRRFEPARLMVCDRGHKRMLHTDLDGNLIGVIAENMRNPSSASFHGDLMCVAEIAGNVSVWDKNNQRVADLGMSPQPTNTPKIEPKDWKPGVVTSPHGITFDNQGNILETEWNLWGRVLRWNRKG